MEENKTLATANAQAILPAETEVNVQAPVIKREDVDPLKFFASMDAKVKNIYEFLQNQKHLLIAGTPGAGKSVLLNGLVCSILHRPPQDVPGGTILVLLDQKGNELMAYKHTPHCARHAVSPEDVVDALTRLITLMNLRFTIMAQEGMKTWNGADVYVIIDEWADLVCTSRKQVIPLIQRLCQKGRAARIHVVLSTQCILSKIVPTEIKCCFDTIVALRTASTRDSKYIIGIPDCYSLPDYGSCYVRSPQFRDPVRYDGIQLMTDEQIEEIVGFWNKPKTYLNE